MLKYRKLKVFNLNLNGKRSMKTQSLFKFCSFIFLCFFYHLKIGGQLVFDLFRLIQTPIL